jgi:hypothetical protein
MHNLLESCEAGAGRLCCLQGNRKDFAMVAISTNTPRAERR